MKSPEPTPTLDTLIGHLIDMLPDSFSRRKKILSDILAVLDPNHPLRVPVGEMLHWLVAHEEHQLQLAIDFIKPPVAASGGGDGQPNGETGK